VAGSLDQRRIRPLGVLLESMKSDPPPDPGSSAPNEPSGMVTANLNLAELANLCCDTIEQVLDAARAGIGGIRHQAQVVVLALRRVGLAPWRWLPRLGKLISRLAEGQPIR
jgi:hypothetical protein